MTRPHLAALLSIAIVPFLAQSALASERPRAIAVRATGPLTLDGVLDEPDWERAPPIGPFRLILVREGEAPSESTDVRVVFTRDGQITGYSIRLVQQKYDFQPPSYARPNAFRESAVTAGNCRARDVVFSQYLAYGNRSIRAVDRTAGRDEVRYVQNVARWNVRQQEALNVWILNVVEPNFCGLVLESHLVLHLNDFGRPRLFL